MRSDARLLIIGPERLREEVGRALPRCTGVGTENALSGVWQAGQQQFDGVIVSLAASRSVLKAIRGLRRVAPDARIIVSCSPSEEPGARRAVQEGADEYVIEPVTREDLERALQIPSVPRAVPQAIREDRAADESAQLVDVLRNLADGPQAALDRLVEMLRQTFEASYVAIRIDELTATSGAAEEPVLQEAIFRHEESVGLLTLGRRERGSYGGTTAARMADYCQTDRGDRHGRPGPRPLAGAGVDG